jgi:carbonic anhydrase
MVVVVLKAAMGNQSIGVIDNWIRHIKDVYRLHNTYLDSIQDRNRAFQYLCRTQCKGTSFDLQKHQSFREHGETIKI